MNNKKVLDTEEYDIAEPHAEAMIQSLRAFGYDIKTAIADLIDNSITARAKNIWVNFYWNGDQSYIEIKDDGLGMTEKEAINAMRLGSQSPLLQRNSKDLGRFGLGLKTASFSQCKKLIVYSKTISQKPVVRCWDLDYVTRHKEWRLLKKGSENDSDYISQIEQLESGTIILWENMDRVVIGTNVDDKVAQHHFLERAKDVKQHLAMVFHRFLENPNSFKICVNNIEVRPWNPFYRRLPATRSLTEEKLVVSSKQLQVEPYILPHHSKLDPETYAEAAGVKGWNEHQGFYVYRNNRMVVDGDWMALGLQREEHCKLARIAIDIPNDMDDEWKIDVKKSKAKPPDSIRSDLKRIAKLTRSQASDVYRHRGKIISRQNAAEYVYLWEQLKRHNKIHYRINRKHPLVKDIFNCDKEIKIKLESLLKLIEETIPIPHIIMQNAENPDKMSGAFEGVSTKEVINVLEKVYESFLNAGLSPNEAHKKILVMEPFNQFVEIVEGYMEKVKGS